MQRLIGGWNAQRNNNFLGLEKETPTNSCRLTGGGRDYWHFTSAPILGPLWPFGSWKKSCIWVIAIWWRLESLVVGLLLLHFGMLRLHILGWKFYIIVSLWPSCKIGQQGIWGNCAVCCILEYCDTHYLKIYLLKVSDISMNFVVWNQENWQNVRIEKIKLLLTKIFNILSIGIK